MTEAENLKATGAITIFGLFAFMSAFTLYCCSSALGVLTEEPSIEREFACKAKPEPERSACLKEYLADIKKVEARTPKPPPPPKRCTPKWIEERARGCYRFTKFEEMTCLKGVDLDIRLCEVEAIKAVGPRSP